MIPMDGIEDSTKLCLLRTMKGVGCTIVTCCQHTVVCKMVRRTIWNALAKVEVDKDVERTLEKVPIELRTL